MLFEKTPSAITKGRDCSNSEDPVGPKFLNVKGISKNNKKLLKGKVTLGSPTRRIPSLKKIKKISGKYPKITFKQALMKTFEWYKEN